MRRTTVLAVGALVLVIGVAWLSAENAPKLVFSDGTSIEAVAVTLKGPFVEVTLPGGAIQRYEAQYVDLEASGLVTKPAPETWTSKAASGPRGRFDDAIAAGKENPDGVKITDQDVGHVKPDRTSREGGVEEVDETPEKRTSLAMSDLKWERVDGVLRVTGKANNTGTEAVTSISITADAQKADGTSAGKGTTGLSQTLEPGGSAEFSIAIPVTDSVSNVRVGATAAVVEFEFEQTAPPDAGEGE